jgi:hypothetical protein
MDGDPMFASWGWGLFLIALTVAIHAVGIVIMSLVMIRLRVALENLSFGLCYVVPIVIGTVATVGLLLAMLHGIEATIWAIAYLWAGAVDSFADGMLYSVDSITTRGASGLMLLPHWRMLGALESANGLLLFGISTAYMFAVMQVYWPMLSHRH